MTGPMILELCQSHELVRYAIPEGYELLLPRFRLETHSVMDGSKAREIHRWVVECWWRSAEKGTLGYYVKIDLLDKSVREFRELPGDVIVPGMNILAVEMAYLDHYGMSWEIGPKSREAADILDELWKARVSEELRKYVLQNQEEHTIGSYLLSAESLSCWNWETLRDTLQEYLELMRKKDELSAEVTELDIERVGLLASVSYLKEAQHKLRITTAQLCYSLGNILNLMGTLADTEQEHLCAKFQEDLQADKQDEFSF